MSATPGMLITTDESIPDSATPELTAIAEAVYAEAQNRRLPGTDAYSARIGTVVTGAPAWVSILIPWSGDAIMASFTRDEARAIETLKQMRGALDERGTERVYTAGPHAGTRENQRRLRQMRRKLN
jgi:hypothetical protein